MPRDGLGDAVRTVEALRGENGCPWDLEQTHASLRKFLLEETYETLEAIDALALGPTPERIRHFKEELGDVLLQVLLHSEIARQNGHFSLQDVAGELSDKLVRRHPHVFHSGFQKNTHDGNAPQTAATVAAAWEKTKRTEKPERTSVLSGIPAALPALQRSLKVIEKVSKVGFQWPDLQGPLDKVREEMGELEHEIRASGADTREKAAALPEEARRKLEGELGDLLFTVANVAYFLQVNPEDALRSMLTRFETRFHSVEDGAAAQGKKLEAMTLDEMDVLWNEAKKREKAKLDRKV